MDNKTLVLLVLTIIGFSTSAYLNLENGQLENTVNSHESTISSHESTISNLEIDVSSLNGVVEGLSEDLDRLESDYEAAQEDISELSGEVEQLESSVENLQEENRALETEKSSLLSELAETKATLTSLQSNYDTLDDNYDYLYATYDSTYSAYEEAMLDLQIEQMLRIGNSLESYYDSLRTGLGPTGTENWWWYSTESLWQTQVDFAVNLAQHDLWRIYWPDYETDYEELTGENSYETAWYKLMDVVSCIDVSMSDPPVEKIEGVLSFLNEQIHYETEINDVFLAPMETLGFKSGDCDDYSILAAALFEYYEIESAVGFFKNDANDYHAMVLVNLDDLGEYGNWYYSDLTSLGLPEGKWIKIEPQSTIENQWDDDWMGQWNILVAQDLEN